MSSTSTHDANEAEDDDCPDCDNTGVTYIDRWSYSRDCHYTEDVPCGCLRSSYDPRREYLADKGDWERWQRKEEPHLYQDDVPF